MATAIDRRLAAVTSTTADYKRARIARDRAIIAARSQGIPLRTIATAAGLTHRGVTLIIERGTS